MKRHFDQLLKAQLLFSNQIKYNVLYYKLSYLGIKINTWRDVQEEKIREPNVVEHISLASTQEI